MIKQLRLYFDQQINEINDDAALRLYGAFISMTFAVVAFHWIFHRFASIISFQPICWPFFENCFQYRLLSIDQIRIIFYLLGGLALIGTVLFLIPKYSRIAFWWLLCMDLLYAIVYTQDFRFHCEQNIILNWVTLSFLCLPNKRNGLRYLLVFIYFCASLLKFNNGWISGNNLYKDLLWIKGSWVSVACIYVVVLEAILVFGLLAKQNWIFWLTLFQLILFHLMSWPIVGFYYPIVMFCMLSIFPLTHFLNYREQSMSLILSLLKGKQAISTYICIAILLGFQIFPMTFPGNSKITSEGRIISLHMFDARIQCEGLLTLKFKNGLNVPIAVPIRETVRIKCDPLVYFSIAKRYCWIYKQDPNFLDIDLKYNACQIKEPPMKPLVNITNFCQQNLHYNMFKTNEWVIK